MRWGLAGHRWDYPIGAFSRILKGMRIRRVRRSIGVWLALLALVNSVVAAANPACMLVHTAGRAHAASHAEMPGMDAAGMAMHQGDPAAQGSETPADRPPCCPVQGPPSVCPLTLLTLPAAGPRIIDVPLSVRASDLPRATGVGPRDRSVAPELPPPRSLSGTIHVA
jgi:hypothetical protein